MSFERVWHRSYAPDVPPEIEIEKITMAETLSRQAKKFPNHIAFIYFGRNISFAEIESFVNRCARALQVLGIKEGDKVAMILPNIPEMIIANHACYRLGAIGVMTNPLYTEAELEHQLNDSESVAAVTLDLSLPRLLNLRPKTNVKTIITCHLNDFMPFPIKQFFPFVKRAMYRKDEKIEGVHPFQGLIKNCSDKPAPSKAKWENPATLIYTGGTTGVSKGAVLTHANISSVVQQFLAWFPDLKQGEESLMGIYPIFHSAGYSVSQNLTIAAGWKCILIPRPEPVAITDALIKFKPSFLPGVPTIYTGLLNYPKFAKLKLDFIKGFFAGAAPLQPETAGAIKAMSGKEIYDVYGLTENVAFAIGMPWKGKNKLGTEVVPLPNTDVKIVDLKTGEKALPAGQEGEICIKGPQVMAGYYNKPAETAAALRDGWLYTGDIGVMDEGGFFSTVDRKKDMVCAGGYNIYPKEIDEVFYENPKVLEACAIGVSDAYRGETIKAFVVLKQGETATEDEIIRFCKEKLAAYKVPKKVGFVESLPKSAVGKILRRELRRMEEMNGETK